MKTSSISILLFVALFLEPLTMSAMHIIGGEITYDCLGPTTAGRNRYRFTMKIYRDGLGGGAPFDAQAEIAIYRGTYQAASLFENFKVALGSSRDLTATPPPCISKVPTTDVEEGVYIFDRELPVLQNQSYFIVYQRCCRNVTIKNLINPGDQGATYFIELTAAAQQLCNDSPVFKQLPPIIICSNFALEFDHSAVDADGDLLVYSFCSPLNGGGPILDPPNLYSCDGAQPTPPCGPPFDNALFVAPNYTPGNPMGGNPQIKINASTGLITGTPNEQGQFVVSVCVEEYRNGVLLSTLRRDFQFNVADCQPTVFAKVSADSIPAAGQYYIIACGNKTVNLKNESFQRNNITEFRWSFDLKGQAYEETSAWDPTITFPDTGTYKGFLYLNPGKDCADTAQITVRVFPGVNAGFVYDFDTCIAGPVFFTDKSYGVAGVKDREWDFGVPNGMSNETNPEFLFPYPGEHNVKLVVRDNNGCRDSTPEPIRWFPAPPVIIVQPDKFLGCTPANIFFNNLSHPIDSTYKIVWDFGDGTRDTGIISPTHLYDEEGIFDVKIQITSPIGCYIEDSFENWIKVTPSPIAAFTCDPDSNLSQFNKTIQFINQSIDQKYNSWQFDRFATSTQLNPVFTFPDTGKVKVTLIVTHAEGCKDSISKILDIRPIVQWFMPNAFTPNGDGQNDEFYGKGVMEGARDFNFTIWNRWGELVFETQNPNDAWNGRVMNTGGMSPAGVYVYWVTFDGPRGEQFEFRGYATLVK